MRLLHTSDWHIGRTFHGHRLLDDQRMVFDALAAAVAEHDIDAVVIAGDIYDRAIPSAEATTVATRAVNQILQAGAKIVAISGNHDSAPRLGAFADVLAQGGLYLRTNPGNLAEPVMLNCAQQSVAVYAIPYLEPEVVRGSLGLAGSVGHREVLQVAMDQVREHAATLSSGTRTVVMAHAFVAGGASSESERSIAVGGVAVVPATVFDGVDYVALGHLHGRQEISPRVRYCGSPLPYSFGESRAEKGAWLIDLPASGDIAASWLTLPTARPLASVRGTLDTILTDHPDLFDHYLAVTLTDRVQPLDAMRQLREQFPHIATLAWEPDEKVTAQAAFPELSASVSDNEILEQFVTDCRGEPPTPRERELISGVVATIRAAEVTG